MNTHGVQAYLSRSIHRRGWEIYLRKYINGKSYKPIISIDWIECNEFEASEPVNVDQITNHENLDGESKLMGENLASKDEIIFLRGEISKQLERLTK